MASPYGLRHGATAIALDCVRKIIVVASVAFVIIECAILDHKLNTLILWKSEQTIKMQQAAAQIRRKILSIFRSVSIHTFIVAISTGGSQLNHNASQT